MVESAVRDRTVALGRSSAFGPDAGGTSEAEALVAARRSLRAQIARLEREIAGEVSAGARLALPRIEASEGVGARLLGMAELERVRDRLVEARVVLRERETGVEHNRELLEAAAESPESYRRLRLTLADVGEAGCGTFTVKPKLGILGRTLGWWRLKLSLGCPLAVATRRARKRARSATPPPATPGREPGPEVSSPPAQRRRATMSSRGDERPLPPWGRAPLTEVAILAGAIVAGVGLLTGAPRVTAGGLLLLGAAAGELAFREHFAGYRSHSSLLAGIVAIVALTGLVFGLRALVPGVSVLVAVLLAGVVFAVTFVALRRAFKERAGVSLRV